MANVFKNPDPLEGPWPECVGMEGESCKKYIEGWIAELAPPSKREHVIVIVDTSTKRPDRVFINSDQYGQVIGHPHTG